MGHTQNLRDIAGRPANPLAADESVPSANLENVIVLSDEFFQEIMRIRYRRPRSGEAPGLRAAILDLSCGSPIVALPPKPRNHSDLRRLGLVPRLGRSSTPVRDDSARTESVDRTIRLAWPEAPQRSAPMASILWLITPPPSTRRCLKSN